ncbi:hypothetical protein ABK040_015021 [Willaertia magna]
MKCLTIVPVFILLSILFLSFHLSGARAKQYTATTSDELWSAMSALQSGDELVIKAGIYSTYGANTYWRNIQKYGTVDQPIIVRAATGEKVVIDGDTGASQNILNLDVKNFVLKGIEFRYGSRGLRFQGAKNVVLEDLHIHDTYDVGVAMNDVGVTYDNVTIRHVQIHGTRGTGECFYLGCNEDSCRLTNSLIEYNWCYDTCCEQGDGIEVKRGSYNNVIRHNVIHDVHYPGIIVYGAANGIPNVVEGNLIWNSMENGIQITANAIVRNNIVLASQGNGIAIGPNQGKVVNVTLMHNTVVGAKGACLSTSATSTVSTNNNLIYANNVFNCEGGKAMWESGPLKQGIYEGNLLSGYALSIITNTYSAVSMSDFANITTLPYDVYPSSSSALIGKGSSKYTVAYDFNDKPRNPNRVDVGAYGYSTSKNPGFIPKPGFKDGFQSTAQTTSPKPARPVPDDNIKYSRNTYIVTPRNASTLFDFMNTLQPGDTLLIREGVYQVKNKFGWLVKIKAFGSPSNPITVAAYPGERVIFEGDYYASQNIINMEVMYFVMRGIEMRYGSRGLRIFNAQHSIFEDLYVHHTWDAAVTFNERGGDYQNITLRHIRVAYTHGTGECFYLGCVGDTCTFYDSIVENNVCEYTCCTQGDGIEIKSGSYNNIIRNNVIHDTNYPGITTYETRGKPPNIIEGNIIWNTNENGIQTTEGAIVRNNIVINAGISGIAVQRGFLYPARVTIEHNTVINSKFACLRLNDLQGSPGDIRVVNNAFYCENNYAYYENYASNDNKPKTFYSANNYYLGQIFGKISDWRKGNSLTDDFVVSAGGLDYYPTSKSILRGAGNSSATTLIDFNEKARSKSVIDVGAYQYSTTKNPGWVVKPSFKYDYTSVAVTGPWSKPTQEIPDDNAKYPHNVYHIYKEINNKNCDREKLWTIMSNLLPGDTLIIHNGTYTTNVCGHGSWYRNIKAVGTPKHPITIKAAEGEKVIIEGDKDASQNIINFSLYYASFKGFELRYGSIGLRLYECQHAVFEDLEVHHTAENAISANQLGAEYVDITFRNVRVHHTGGNAGECFYLGCNYGQCIMRDSLIENNYCAYTCCGQGDGIELKQGSYNNIIRNNVVHDTNYPGITLYSSDEGLAPNIVEGNIIWNTNENGLQVTGGAVIRNNIVMNARLSGIAVQVNQGKIRDLSIVHNTVVNAGFACLGTYNTNTGKQLVISGNALYCENGVAIYENQPNPSTKYGINVVRGTSSAPFTVLGKGLTEDFENATVVPYNLYPKKNGALYNIANTTFFAVVDTDFNGKQRSNQRMDVGAYQYITGYDSNPGWIPSASPRPLTAAPPKKSSKFILSDQSNASTTNVPMLFVILLSLIVSFIIF